MNTRHDRPFELRLMKRAEDAAPSLAGMALRYGRLDSYATVFAPGCAAGAIPSFLKEGSFLSGHDDRSLPIGFPRDARDTGEGVEVELDYHTTEEGMAARKVAEERLAAGLRVGLSIGFSIGDYAICESGEALLDLAREMGMDLQVFDVESIRKRTDSCYLITRLSKFFEVSQVNFPAVPDSEATSVRQHNLGALDGVPFADQLSNALGALEAVITRAKEIKDLRDATQKRLGKATLDKLEGIRDGIDELIKTDSEPTALERQQAKFAQSMELMK